VITADTLRLARTAAKELRQRGEQNRARAIEALVAATSDAALPTLDVLTSTEAGDILGVSGQTIKNWVRQGRLTGYRVGSRIMVPKDAVADFVRRARGSLDLEDPSDEAAARLVEEGRQGH
jgi:excisionase family DNA binding protein